MRDFFAEHGFVRFDRLVPADVVHELTRELWSELHRVHDIVESDPGTWTPREPRALGALRKRGVFDALATPEVVAAISELLGTTTWPPPFSWGDPLVTMPTPGEWAVPATGWHIDFPARSTLRLKWLAYLGRVGPGGGGTVVLDGSHRLVEAHLRANPDDQGRSSTLRHVVFRDDWRSTVVELTGDVGDVVFLHPRLFHAPAPNHAGTPRLMATGGLAS